MPRLFQINATANWGSTGKIAELIGKLAMEDGWESWIAYGRQMGKSAPTSESHLIRIGSNLDNKIHALETRIFDNHGLSSSSATKKLIEQIKEIKPDIVHLHNVHGYYLNYELLFEYLKESKSKVVWTLHDCWSFTGHCSYFEYTGCEKWKTGCLACPEKKSYPSSLFFDRSKRNFLDKKKSFSSLRNLTLVPVSKWLQGHLNNSFLSKYSSLVIYNGIDLNIFQHDNNARKVIEAKYDVENKTILISVASVWENRKGLNDIFKLSKLLPEKYQIIIVGLSNGQLKKIPKGLIGLTRTENVGQLVELYSAADAFINPTYEDTYPTTNLEALACGTPVITYNTGGSPESLNPEVGKVVEKGNIEQLAETIMTFDKKKPSIVDSCIKWAKHNFNSMDNYRKYLNLYEDLIKNQQ